MFQELAAPCTCGLLYGGSCGGGCRGAAASAFSLLFPMPGEQYYYYRHCGVEEAASVDCTLSLATPSTRRAGAAPARDVPSAPLHAGGNQNSCAGGGGCLPARRCFNCDTTSTPLWRNGPRGPKSLCNACGIRYKKEERRAASAVAPAPQEDSGVGIGYAYGYALQQQPQWGCYGPIAAKSASAFAMFGAATSTRRRTGRRACRGGST